MNGEPPPSELNDFMLPDGLEHVPDIIAVGTQESSPERFDWEVKIQETIGPSHVLFHSAALGTIHLAIFLRRDLLWYCSGVPSFSYPFPEFYFIFTIVQYMYPFCLCSS